MVVQRLDERLQHQDRRDVADQVGQHGRHQAQHRNLVETKPPHGGYHVRRQQGVLRSGDGDEQADEHQQQRPVDLGVDPLAF